MEKRKAGTHTDKTMINEINSEGRLVHATFVKVAGLVAGMDAELQRHVREGLSEDELAFFVRLSKAQRPKTERERLKQASQGLLASLKERIAPIPNWTKNATTQAEVRVLILDTLHATLPRPAFTDEVAESLAERIYGFVWQRSEVGALPEAA